MFVEKPTSPHAQKATWSEYKQHNTIKTLVGITPNGYFSFLSKFWSGNTSDRKITQKTTSLCHGKLSRNAEDTPVIQRNVIYVYMKST